jgi:D-tyrosyl-tRNA(Tyr) deacylase
VAALSIIEDGDERSHALIDTGLLVLAAIEQGDTGADQEWMAGKIAHLRIFADDEGKMNRSVLDVGGEVLLVSNFTVAGDARKGRRPSFDRAMRPPEAEAAFEALADALRELGVRVQTGVFGAHMHVSLVNDGPVTIWLDSRVSGD